MKCISSSHVTRCVYMAKQCLTCTRQSRTVHMAVTKLKNKPWGRHGRWTPIPQNRNVIRPFHMALGTYVKLFYPPWSDLSPKQVAFYWGDSKGDPEVHGFICLGSLWLYKERLKNMQDVKRLFRVCLQHYWEPNISVTICAAAGKERLSCLVIMRIQRLLVVCGF